MGRVSQKGHPFFFSLLSLSLAPPKDIKVSTSVWMKNSGLFPSFRGWAEGYGSFTCSYMDLGRLIDYIKIQQEHHRKKTFEEEYRTMLMESGLKIDERYFP